MTRDEIVKMAREAGFYVDAVATYPKPYDDVSGCGANLARFAELVAAAEREACAEICDAVLNEDGNWSPVGYRFAAAIRARGQG